MKHLAALLALFVVLVSVAQPPVPQFPPVPGDDIEREHYGLWANPGWVLDTDGQLRPDVQFVSEGGYPRTYIRQDATISWVVTTIDTSSGGTDTLRRLDMSLVGETSMQPDAIASSAKIQEKHFYLPHCGTNGVTNVPGYNRIVYPNIYPGIDLWVFSGILGQKVMFVVWPGGDPDDIVLDFTGQNELIEDLDGWLRILLADKWISVPQPVAYQFDQFNTIQPLLWTADYTPTGNSGIVTMEYDAYDPTKPLVLLIGPPAMAAQSYNENGLCWSTFVGDDGDDQAENIRTDSQGNIYITGSTSSTLVQFPADPGLINAASGSSVAFLSKFTPDLQPSWAVFIGGEVSSSISGAEALAIREGAQQRIFFGGWTRAQDFFDMPNGNAFYDPDNLNSSFKGFISEVNENGELQWSTYFGEHDVFVEGMDIVPGLGHLVICGQAMDDLPDEQYDPLTGELDQGYVGEADAFVALFDLNDQLYMRSWYGGASTEVFAAVRASSSQIYLAGHTGSDDIEMVDPQGGAYAQEYMGQGDCVLVELNHQGAVLWSTYLGGPGEDYLGTDGLAIGPDRDVFLCGNAGSGFPIEPGPNWFDNTAAVSTGNGFIARFSGVDRSELWLTYMGSGDSHVGMSIIQSNEGMIAVAGHSNGNDLPYQALPGWYDQVEPFEYQHGSFLVRFSNAQELLHGTWFGGDQTTASTWLSSIAPYFDGVIATGHLQKGFDVLSYWPLDDGGYQAWVDDQYNHMNQSLTVPDAFITYFCSELSVGIEAWSSTYPYQPILIQDAGSIQVLGLPDGYSPFVICDVAGRSLMRGNLVSRSGRSESMAVVPLSIGVYLLVLPGREALRFTAK